MALSLENVSKKVGEETHINNVSLQLEPGTINVLLGLTLSGKTSLMRLMAGLDRPTSGRVLARGSDVARIPVRKRNVAMVYQQFINYPSLTVYENIASPLRLLKMDRQEIDRRVRLEAERMGIEHLLERLPDELSGGQQQRTAMARALVRDADAVLLDEPLVNLDYKLREALRNELRDIFRDRGCVVVYATTDPWEALALGGRTAVLHEGRLIQFGETPAVYAEPANQTVARVFSDPPMNLINGFLEPDRVRFSDGEAFAQPAHLETLPPGDYAFGLRPYHLSLKRSNDAEQRIVTTVDVSEISGSETYIHFRLDGRPCVAVQEGVHSFGVDQEVELFFHPKRLFAFDRNEQLVAAPDSATDQEETGHGQN